MALYHCVRINRCVPIYSHVPINNCVPIYSRVQFCKIEMKSFLYLIKLRVDSCATLLSEVLLGPGCTCTFHNNYMNTHTRTLLLLVQFARRASR